MPIERLLRRPASLALRVTAFVGLATTLVFVAFGWIVVRSLEHHFAELDAGELAVVAATVQDVLREAPPDGDRAALRDRLARAVSGHHGVAFQVRNAGGALLYASPGPDLDALATEAPVARLDAHSLVTREIEGQSLRTARLRVAAPGGVYALTVASAMDEHLHYLQDFRRTLWLATFVVCAIALLAARLAVLQGHAPLRRISAQMRGISSARLHVRLHPQEVPAELAGLVEAFNEMLARIEDGFRQLSDFSADIAHELRTPVTSLTTQTQVALGQARGVEEYREILYSQLEEFERMRKMIGDMLFLAQTEHDPQGLAREPVDLAALVHELFDFFEALAEDQGVALVLTGQAPPVVGDAPMLRRALANLLSNAVRHTAAGGCVTVRLSAGAGRSVLAIDNPGEPVAAEHLPRLFERFYRVDPARQRRGEGAGLGLAIVRSIVEAHQGEVRAEALPAGMRFEISLPQIRVSSPSRDAP